MFSPVISADLVSKTGSFHEQMVANILKRVKVQRSATETAPHHGAALHLRSPESVTCTPSFFAFSASHALPSGVVAEHIVAARPRTRAVKTFIVELLVLVLLLLS